MAVREQQQEIQAFLVEGCKGVGLHLTDDATHTLGIYVKELQRWSSKINLIAKNTTVEQIVENHFIDSLILLPYLDQPNASLIDIGSGAGFPGLVCKAALPELSLTLVEPRLKRVSFLRHIIRTLQLTDVEVVAERIEDIDTETLSYNYITCRAVAEVQEFLEMVAPLIHHGVEIICMKGPKWHDELDKASNSMRHRGIMLSKVREFELPYSKAKRALLFFNKS